MKQESEDLGGGPLTRTELAIVVAAVVILALMVASTLARAARRTGAEHPDIQQLPQPVAKFSTGVQGVALDRFATGAMAGAGITPLTIPGGISNGLGDASGFSGFTNQGPVDWSPAIPSGTPQMPGH